MRKYILIYILFNFIIFNTLEVNAQIVRTGAVISSSNPNTVTGGLKYVASESIRLLPGFSTNSSNGNFLAKIDKNGQFRPNYSSTAITANAAIDKEETIGTIAGGAGVSAIGGATYQIPIFTPPGTNGMQPNISIAYNSQAGNGILGKGCSIAGLSAITRTGDNLYFDDNVKGVTFQFDNFMLDGQRLIHVKTKDNWQAFYRTEVESFTNIYMNGWSNNAPNVFYVEHKNGLTYVYGEDKTKGINNDTRIEAQGKSNILVWPVSRIYDKNGNYIKFIYEEDNANGEYWIKEIQYTGNLTNSLTPYNKIQFFYDLREDVSVGYVCGSKVTRSRLLRKIEVTCESKLVRKYKFDYTYSIRYGTQLNKITEYDENNNRHNSTILDWHKNTSLSSYTASNLSTSEKVITGDFNGDGNMDAVKLPKNKLGYYTSWSLYLGNGNNTFTSTTTATITANGYGFIRTGDFNRDGKMDFAYLFLVNRQHDVYTYAMTYYISNDRGGFDIKDVNSWHYAKYEDISDFVVGDFNGDLISDYAIKTNKKIYVGISKDLKYGYSTVRYPIQTTWDIAGIMNFDGDAKNDLLLLNKENNEIKVLEFNGVIFSVLRTDNFGSSKLYIGDFNGDGLSDILAHIMGVNAYMEIHYSTGNGFKKSALKEYIHYSDGNNIRTGDFNGDGRSDIAYYDWDTEVKWDDLGRRSSYDNNFHRDFLYSYGDGLFRKETTTDYKMYTPTLISDFNNDGQADIYDTKRGIIQNLYPNEKTALVNKVRDGLGNQTIFSYKKFIGKNSRLPSLLSMGRVKSTYFSSFIVDEVSNLMIGKTTPINRISYLFEEPLFHNVRGGFLGFKKRTVEDHTSTIKTVSTSKSICINDNYPLLPYTTETFLRNTLKSKVTSLYTVEHPYYPISGKVIYPRLISTTSEDFVNNNKVTSTFTTDISTGNITNVSVKYSGDGGTTVEGTTVTKYENFTDKGSWIASKPQKVTVTKTRGAEPPYTRVIKMTYTLTGQSKLVIKDPLQAEYRRNVYFYDKFGNVSRVYKIGTGITTTVSMNFYDNKGRFVIKHRNVMRQIEYYTYNSIYGSILTSKGVDGHTITYNYGAFGRLRSTELPTGEVVSNNIYWGTAPINKDGLVSHTSSNWNTWSKSYSDVYGRNVRTESSGFNGKVICKVNKYNVKNQLIASSDPFFAGATPVFSNTYKYNTDGRIKKTIANLIVTPHEYSPRRTVGRRKKAGVNEIVTTYTYYPKRIVVNGPGYRSDKKMNVFGQPTEIRDIANNSILYTYHSSGAVKEVKGGGSTINMEYDKYGNQTLLSDPDAGDRNYTYNILGQLKTQIDAENNTTTLTYDRYNRLDTKTDVNGDIITYNYISSGNGINQVGSIISSGPNEIITNQYFKYDDFGRLIKLRENIDGTDYIHSYKYSSKGEMVKETYPHGFFVNYLYDSYGFLKEIKKSNQRLYRINSVNARGQITNAIYGNRIIGTNTYDNFGTLTGIVRGNIQNYEIRIDYNRGGNIKSRKDNINNLEENFHYDNLNRLIGERIHDNTGSHSVENSFNSRNNYIHDETSYSANGNIKEKYNVGVYSYNRSDKPHALTNIASSSNQSILTEPQTIYYTSFNKIADITQGTKYATFAYGPDEERKKVQYFNSHDFTTPIKTKYYSGNYEKIEKNNGDVIEYNYVAGFGVYRVENGVGKMLYTFKDHLGSITKIADINGNLLEEQSFNAWGLRRNPRTGELNAIGNEWTGLLDRGFTGHEHMDEFSLINMNGRFYDPITGRMMSPDNFVQDGGNSQNFNRYSYCLNNPLKYTDPSGEFWHLVIGAAIGGTFNVMTNLSNIDNFGQGFGYFAVGAAAGALSAGIGAGVNVAYAGGSFAAGFMGTAGGVASTGFVAGAVTGASAGLTNGLVQGTGNGMLGGQSFGDAFVQGGLEQSWRQGLASGITGGLLGGFDALSKDVDFFTGDATFDTSEGYGAHNIKLSINKIKSKYVGDFEGVNMYESKALGTGYGSGGITLPGKGIFVGKGAFSRGLDMGLVRHEFGHILQSRILGYTSFYTEIGKESLLSASAHGYLGHSHNNFWTETWANKLSYNYFGKPTYWNNLRFPIQDISTFNKIRLLISNPYIRF